MHARSSLGFILMYAILSLGVKSKKAYLPWSYALEALRYTTHSGIFRNAIEVEHHGGLGLSRLQHSSSITGVSRSSLPIPYTLHPTPTNITGLSSLPIPCTLYPTLYTLHPTPYNRHPSPYTLCSTPHTLHPIPRTLCPTLYTLSPVPHHGDFVLSHLQHSSHRPSHLVSKSLLIFAILSLGVKPKIAYLTISSC